MSSNNTKSSTISYGTTNSGSNSAQILPDDYKFKGDGSNSHRWHEVKDQVLNKAMSLNGFKMSLLEERQTLDTDLYKNSKGEVTASIQLQLLKKKEEMEEKEMKVFGVLMKKY